MEHRLSTGDLMTTNSSQEVKKYSARAGKCWFSRITKKEQKASI